MIGFYGWVIGLDGEKWWVLLLVLISGIGGRFGLGWEKVECSPGPERASDGIG